MHNKIVFAFLLLFKSLSSFSQLNDVYFDAIDSLIETTPQISLCIIDGKEDLRFFTRTPEKYSDYKQVFLQKAIETLVFSEKNHFRCDIQVEINCEGEAGNYSFSIEPRTFTLDDYNNFVALIALVNRLKDFEFKPAAYLTERVNSKAKFRLVAINGHPVLQ